MMRQSKRTSAPVPQETSSTAQAVRPPMAQPVPPLSIPSVYGPGVWCPPRPPLQPTGSAGYSWPATNFPGDTAMEEWGLGARPPGGFLNFLNSSPEVVNCDSESQPINIGADDHDDDRVRTEKRLTWTKEEDLRLVSAWLNNSNDPIQANYKKNDQYWKGVTDVFNSTTPKSRVRSVKQIKDHFARIKKRVAWFCGSWKEANALWASGESDVQLMDRAMKSYEEDHKKDGPFMYKHCWDVLCKEPKWDAYLERLEDLEPDKRKFSVEEDVGQHFSLDDARGERPPGSAQTKKQNKRKKIDQSCIIDLEDGLDKFVEAPNKATEGRKEILETQRKVSANNLEAKKFAHLANKEHKETILLETYRQLLMQDTTKMAEDVRSKHVLAIKLLREKLSNN